MKAGDALEHTLKALEADLKACTTDEARLSRILERAREISGAERGFVLMTVPESTELRVMAAHGIEPSQLWTTAEISVSIIRDVLKNGRAVISENATVDPRFCDTNSVVLSGLRSVLCVPIKSGRRTTAIIYLDNRAHVGVFQKLHLTALQNLARTAATRVSVPAPRRAATRVASTRKARTS